MQVMWRYAALIAIPSLIGGTAATVRGLPWKVDLAAAQQEIARLSELERRMPEIRAQHGVTLDELRAKLAEGVVVLDARAEAEYVKRHLLMDNPSYPPTLNVEPSKAANQQDRLMQLLGQPIVIYCNSLDCHLGEELLLELEKIGFQAADIRIFFPGWDGIVAAGLPTAAGADHWTGYDGMMDPTPDGDSPDIEPADANPDDSPGARPAEAPPEGAQP